MNELTIEAVKLLEAKIKFKFVFELIDEQWDLKTFIIKHIAKNFTYN